MLPTRDAVLFSSVAVSMPDGPVMDDVALCTVGVLLSAPKELSKDDICSTKRLVESSLDVVRVGGSGGDTVEGRALII
jgi:hypothetical protein